MTRESLTPGRFIVIIHGNAAIDIDDVVQDE